MEYFLFLLHGMKRIWKEENEFIMYLKEEF